ncbi:MAG: DUF58 domain-containing protein [Desulfobacteraceae bacterium]|nr:DUF58 domain-containing protein [Desulfobacteraceae bacterium]
MIVPTKRLIFFSAIFFISASLLAVKDSPIFPFASSGALGFILLAVLDVLSGKSRFKNLEVSSPGVVRMTAGRLSLLPLSFQKPGDIHKTLRIIPILPESVHAGEQGYTVNLTKGEIKVTVPLQCKARIRGKYNLTACFIDQSTIMGLWVVRRKFALNTEIRVYPNLITGQKQILGLFHRREWGWRNLRKIGKGREFEQLRDYLPGDSYEDIDWKATARRRHPITRDFEVEQSQEIYIMLDASRLSTRVCRFENQPDPLDNVDQKTSETTIFERYIIGALTMAMAADRAGDRYGLLIFSTKPDIFLKAGRGKAHYNACMEALYNHMPSSVSPDFEEVFAFIGSTIRKRAMLVFLTHLDDPLLSESFINTLNAVNRQHVVIINMMRPNGAHPLFSSALDLRDDKNPEKAIYEKLLGHMIWSSLSTTRRKLFQYGAGFVLLNEKQLCSQLIDQYREVKQRQII